jgi:hypothetical protein
MLSLALIACTPVTGDFLTGSGRFEPSNQVDTGDSSGSGGDTADTAGSVGDEGAPVLVDPELTWEDYADRGIALIFRSSFTDEGDDILGGTCFLDLYIAGVYTDDYELLISEDPTDNDGKVCFVVEDQIMFAFEGLDDNDSAGIDLVVRDSSRNDSAAYELYVDGQ